MAPYINLDWCRKQDWQGILDSYVEQYNILYNIEQNMPVVTTQIRNFLSESNNENDCVRRAFTVLDIVDHLVGERIHLERPPLSFGPWRELYNRMMIHGRLNANNDIEYWSVIPALRSSERQQRPESRLGRNLLFIPPIHGGSSNAPCRLRYRYLNATNL